VGSVSSMGPSGNNMFAPWTGNNKLYAFSINGN
jgi:hypothetical protein